MVRRYSGQKPSAIETIEIVKLEKSGGCVDRDEEYTRQFRQAQVREYFLGDAKNTLSPHIQHVDFSQLTIYKFVESTFHLFEIFLHFSSVSSSLQQILSFQFSFSFFVANNYFFVIISASEMLTSLLPGGELDDSSYKSPILEKVPAPSIEMQNSILVIMQAGPNDTHESIRDASVMGFVYVAEVDEKRKKVKILAPLSGRLPARAMIWDSFGEEGIVGLVD